MERMIFLVPLLPLAGFLVNLVAGRRLGRRAVGAIASGAILASFLVALAMLRHLLSLAPEARTLTIPGYTWVQSGALRIDIAFLYDPLSAVMITMVTGVAFLIHVYSTGYMAHDHGFPRFFAYLNLFTAAMLLLVLADNFLVAFIGWEGVGLCSYLLIGFWFDRPAPPAAGMKAFVVNRVGDFGFILATLILFTQTGSLRFLEVFHQAPLVFAAGGGLVTAATLLLFLGATGKSAQLPLHVWLADAMEGPTPVSALIHAATMVTAGVYMVARCHALFQMAPVSLAVVAGVGATTALVAGTMALVQVDIKKVLAYSTVSQLGYMFLALGVGAFSAGIFHLITHAFFKSLLFLGAGSIMHALDGELDLRRMGGLRSALPRTSTTFMIASLALAGIFPFAGFFSKDAILGAALERGHYLIWFTGLLAALLTAVYIFRLVFLVFYGKSRLSAHAAAHVHESPPVMTVPLIALALLAIVGGFLGVPHADVLGRFLQPVFGAPEAVAEPAAAARTGAGAEILGMLVALAVALTGIAIAHRVYLARPGRSAEIAVRWRALTRLFEQLWFFEYVYGNFVVRPVRAGSGWLARQVDVGVVDNAVNGLGRWLSGAGELIRRVQTGIAQNYAFFMGLGAIAMLGFFLFR